MDALIQQANELAKQGVPTPVLEFLQERQNAIFEKLGALSELLGLKTDGQESSRKFQMPGVGRIKSDEMALLSAMASILDEHDLVLDIGAGSGGHALYLAEESGCKVAAFEPDPELCESLRESILLNGLDGRVSLVLKDADSAADTVKVPPLDAMMFGQPVKAIRIDVGGTELDVLGGAKSLIQRDQPALFVSAPTESSLDQLSRVLGEWGYAYEDTFGSAPIHWFLPLTLANKPEVVAGESGGENPAEQKVRKLESENRALKDELATARQKYRAVNELVASLKARLADANAKYRAVNIRHDEVRKLVSGRGQEEGGDSDIGDEGK